MKGYKAFNEEMVAYMFDGKRQYAEHTVFESNETGVNAGMAFYLNPFELLDDYSFVRDTNGEFNIFAKTDALSEATTNSNARIYRTAKLEIGDRLSFDDFVKECVEFAASKTSTSGGITDKYVYVDDARGKTDISSTKDKVCIANAETSRPVSNSSDLACVVSAARWGCISSSGECVKIGSTGDHSSVGSAGLDASICSSGDESSIASAGDGTVIGNLGSSTCIASAGADARVNSDGEGCVICCAGDNSCAKAKRGSWITLAEWKYDKEKKETSPSA